VPLDDCGDFRPNLSVQDILIDPGVMIRRPKFHDLPGAQFSYQFSIGPVFQPNNQQMLVISLVA
jgi:hypothetical protein